MAINKCEEYATQNNIQFITDPDPVKSKSKFILVCGAKKNMVKPAPLILGCKDLPWVRTASELHKSGNLDHVAIVISQSVDVRQTFHFASPVEVISALKLYCSSFYDCMVWDLGGEGAGHIYNSWSTAVKPVRHVPRATRTYLVQKLLSGGITYDKVDILGPGSP